MKKSKFIILIILLLSITSVFLIIYDGFNSAPSRISINYRYIKDDKINKDLNNLQIAFISDIYFDEFFNEKRLENLTKEINDINPDIVIFLGDLVSDKSSDLSEESIKILKKNLKKLTPKYGKFAVLGEADYSNEERLKNTKDILFNSDFQTLSNEMLKITKDSNQYFQLVGIDSPLNAKDDVDSAYKNVNKDIFTLTIMHTPDTVKKLPQNKTDLAVAGHSRGGQIKIPLLGQIYNQPLAEVYYSGLYRVGEINLFVTNGIGTSNKDVRIFAPAEIVVYTLQSK